MKKQASLLFIFITILVDVIGIGIIIPLLPKLIGGLTSQNLGAVSRIGGYLSVSFALMQFLCAPIVGSLSDAYGRRPVLLVALFCLGIDYIFMAFAPTIFWLFVGRIIAGIAGSSFTTASAYIADISTPQNKAQNFGLVGAAFGLGFIIGPVLGGLLGQFSTQLPFLVSAGLALANLVYGFFILPESLSPDKRRPFSLKKANPVASFISMRKLGAISGLLIALFLAYLSGMSVQGIWTYYGIEKFQWDEKMIGYSLGFVGLVVAAVQGGLLRVLSNKFSKQNIIYWALGSSIISLFLFAIATKTWMMFAITVSYAFGNMAGPLFNSLISNAVPADKQGETQGAISSIMSAATIIGPLFMTQLFAFFAEKNASGEVRSGIYFPGAPFIAGAILALLCLLMVIYSTKKMKLEANSREEIIDLEVTPAI